MTVGAIVPLPSGVDPAVFTSLGGDPVLARVVRALLGQGRVSQSHTVVVAVAPLATGVRECLAAHGLSQVAVAVAPQSGDRWVCVRAGLKYLAQEQFSISQVLLHDHRHPLAPPGVTDRVIDGLRNGGVVVMPSVVVTDSVKAVDELGSVSATVGRQSLRSIQFPRGFPVLALSELVGEDHLADFDELDAALRAGLPIATVEGDAEALRIELPVDAGLLAAIMAGGRSG
jgi:2-C-methyl-D-erythritol 4-phosphate cytidylyltransferase